MYGWRAQVGVLVPAVNTCTEPQFRSMAPPGVEFYATRLHLAGTSREELLAMADKVEEAAGLLAELEPSFILYHCTGSSMIGGAGHDEEIKTRIERATGIPAGTTASGVVLALRALDVHRIALVSTGSPTSHAAEVAYLAEHGCAVVADLALDMGHGAARTRVEPGDWYRTVRGIDRSRAEAILVTCTNLRVIEMIELLEQDCGLPVVTSNQSGLWYVLRRLGLRDRIDGYGRLLREHPVLP